MFIKLSVRGAEHHYNGYLPAAFCELYPKDEMARLAGVYSLYSTLLLFYLLLLRSFDTTQSCLLAYLIVS